MNDNNRGVLRRYHDDLCKDIIVTEELLGELYQVGLFHKDLIEIIRCQTTPSDKIQKLLELIPKRGPDALDKFIGVIEHSYPWLATVLTSAQVKAPAKAPDRNRAKTPNSIGNSKGLSRSSLNLDDQQWNLVDIDIKRIVAAFVHRQFGQSKRVSEKDKKSVERFMADQIQRERTRYQSILASTSSSTPISRPESVSDNVFQSSELQENLFSLHLKMEKYVIGPSKTDSSDGAAAATFSQDDDGHPDKRHRPPPEPKSNEEYGPPRLMPEDVDFNMVNKEVDIVTKQVELLEGTIAECLDFFDTRDHHHTLPALVQNLVTRLDYQENEMAQDRAQIKHLLDEGQNQSEQIERLEKERVEHRKQIQAAYLDMATLRQEKCALQERVAKLEKERRHYQQEESHRMKLGIISKSVKTTPRNGPSSYSGVGIMASRNYTSGTGGNTVSSSVGSEDGYARRGITKTTQRPGNTYLSYARRYPQGGRYGNNVSAKKKGKADYYSPGNNFNSTAKF